MYIRKIKWLLTGIMLLIVLAACQKKTANGLDKESVPQQTAENLFSQPQLELENGKKISFEDLDKQTNVALTLLTKISFPKTKLEKKLDIEVEQLISSTCVSAMADDGQERKKWDIVLRGSPSLELIQLISPSLLFNLEARSGKLSCDLEIRTHLNGVYKKWNFIFNTPVRTVSWENRIQIMKGTEIYVGGKKQLAATKLPIINEINFSKYGIVSPIVRATESYQLECETFRTSTTVTHGGAVSFTNFNYYTVAAKSPNVENPIQVKLVQNCRIYSLSEARISNLSGYFRLKFASQTSLNVERHFPLRDSLAVVKNKAYKIRVGGLKIENTSQNSLYYLIPFASLNTKINLYSLSENKKFLSQQEKVAEWDLKGVNNSHFSSKGKGRVVAVKPGGRLELSYVLYGKHECFYPREASFGEFNVRDHDIGYLGFFYTLLDDPTIYQINQLAAPKTQDEIIAKIPVFDARHKQVTWVWYGEHKMTHEEEERAARSTLPENGRPKFSPLDLNTVLRGEHAGVRLYSHCKDEFLPPYWEKELVNEEN